MVEFSQVLSRLDLLGESMDHLKATADETRAEVKANAAESKREWKELELRLRGVEDKVALVRGMWLAVTLTAALFGIAGAILAAALAIKRLFLGG